MGDARNLLPVRLKTAVLDCPDVRALSDFYARMLGWKVAYSEGDEWIDIAPPRGGTGLGFQKNEDYLPPVWPEEPGAQQQMLHLDFAVAPEQMDAAVAHAIACGARRAPVQFSDRWTVMIDPVGHPFCFVT